MFLKLCEAFNNSVIFLGALLELLCELIHKLTAQKNRSQNFLATNRLELEELGVSVFSP